MSGRVGPSYSQSCASLQQSATCRKPLRQPAFLPSDSCHYFCITVKDLGILLSFVIAFWGCVITAGLFTPHLLRHNWAPFPLWDLVIFLYLLIVIRAQIPLMSWPLLSSLSLEIWPQLTSWLQSQKKPWARGPCRLLTHRRCEIINVSRFKLLSFRVICYTAIDNKYNGSKLKSLFVLSIFLCLFLKSLSGNEIQAFFLWRYEFCPVTSCYQGKVYHNSWGEGRKLIN